MVGASAFFSWKPTMRPSGAASITPNSAACLPVDRDGRHGDLGPLLLVELDHAGDVHPVDVIGAEDRHQVRVGLLDQVDVLVDGVGRALIPGLVRRAHLRGHRDDEVVLEEPAELPAVGQVLQ